MSPSVVVENSADERDVGIKREDKLTSEASAVVINCVFVERELIELEAEKVTNPEFELDISLAVVIDVLEEANEDESKKEVELAMDDVVVGGHGSTSAIYCSSTEPSSATIE